jgi:hypothetical protein
VRLVTTIHPHVIIKTSEATATMAVARRRLPSWDGRRPTRRLYSTVDRRMRKQYIRLAEEARAQAEKSISPDDKRRWLEIAEGWLKLAQVEAREAAQRNSGRSD